MTAYCRSVVWAATFGVLFTVVELLGLALQVNYSVYQIVWMRYGVHLIIMLFVLGGRYLQLPFHAQNWLRQIFRSLLMLAMPLAWGRALSSGVDPMLLAAGLAASPLLVALLVQFWRGRAVNANAWACATLSIAGGMLICRHHTNHVADLILPITSAFCFALYIVETEKLRNEPLSVNLFLTGLWVFLALTPPQLWTWTMPPVHDLPFIVAIGAAGLMTLLALDHMTRGPGFVSGTVFVNVQALVPVGLAISRDRGIPPRATLAALVLMGAAATLSWLGPSFAPSAESET